MLAKMNAASDKQGAALADLQKVIARNPNDISALMMAGILYERQSNFPAARDMYERILSTRPYFTSALNNLAFLYAEEFHDLGKAYGYAQRARALQPNDPHIADTLGWILYERKQYPWALSILREAASKLPREAEVQYHAGMAFYVMGDEARAASTFNSALSIDSHLPDAPQVRQRLAILALDVEAVKPGNLAPTEAMLGKDTSDPIAQLKLARAYDRAGKTDMAAAADRGALAINPDLLAARIGLARELLAENNASEAANVAEPAHKIAPDDPEVNSLLGRAEFLKGDYRWSASLLQEAAGVRADDAVVQFDLAEALYSVGKVDSSLQAAQRALDDGLGGPSSEDARRLLKFGALLKGTSFTEDESAQVRDEARKDPDYVPAIVDLAAIEASDGHAKQAASDYERALKIYPEFTPAVRRLAILLSKNPAEDEQTATLAAKAREDYPDDAELAEAMGLVSYRKSDFRRSSDLLEQSAREGIQDPAALFYLGMSQFRLNERSQSRQSLQKALALNLAPDLATKARETLRSLQ
jgi:tetratricopeptide (TPR) repeat protein